MAAATLAKFVDGLIQSQLLSAEQCEEVRRLQTSVHDARELGQELLRRAWLTAYQINQTFQGKGNALTIGPYVVLERLGEGGMGQIFKARQKILGRIVALKVVRKECLGNPKVILRFQREIRAAGQLSHPHIVRAYDADQVNGAYYIAMEYIDGVDLSKLVKDKGPLAVDQACEYIRQAALGLQHAFERGLVHRDIKPANLLMSQAIASDRRRSSGLIPRPRLSSGMIPRGDLAKQYPWGVVKILDMGLARWRDPATGRETTHLTKINTLMGTPEYIAPEQARDSHNSDIRADLYSLGCTLYFLLTERPPFPDGTITDKLLQHQFDVPDPVEAVRRASLAARKIDACEFEARVHVPPAVESLLQKLMAKDPADRFQTPMELAGALQDILQNLAASASKSDPAALTTTVTLAAPPTVPIAPQVHRPFRKTTNSPGQQPLLLACLGGLAVLVLATLLGVILALSSRSHAAPGEPEAAPQNPAAKDPYWKLVIRKAIQNQIPWEEAREEVMRERAAVATAARTRGIDEWLARIPSRLDGLERKSFAEALAPPTPAEVIGAFNPARPSVPRPVLSLAVSSSGRWLASPDEAGVRVFDLGAPLHPFNIPAHGARVNRVAISPDGWLLASASDDGSVRVWDLERRTRILSFDKHQRPVTQLAFHPEGKLLASAGRDGFIRIWDPRTGLESRAIRSPFANVTTLAFAPDGAAIIWGGWPRVLHWASVNNATAGTFATRSPGQRMLASQPSGNLVILGGWQGPLQVCAWDGKALKEKTTLQTQKQIHDLAFSRDGRMFVSAGVEPALVVRDARTLQPTRSINLGRGAAFSATFAPDGRHILAGGANGQIFVVRLANHDMAALRRALD
ncbi:MAG: protein kinase [Planctomycetes bacterium]|nr:protein kinase [Planctomycetota bacterium]